MEQPENDAHPPHPDSCLRQFHVKGVAFFWGPPHIIRSFITLRGAAASAVASLVGSIFAALFRVNALVLLGRVKVVRYYRPAMHTAPI